MANTIVLVEGELTTENEDDRATVSRIKGLGLNLATLPRDTIPTVGWNNSRALRQGGLSDSGDE